MTVVPIQCMRIHCYRYLKLNTALKKNCKPEVVLSLNDKKVLYLFFSLSLVSCSGGCPVMRRIPEYNV